MVKTRKSTQHISTNTVWSILYTIFMKLLIVCFSCSVYNICGDLFDSFTILRILSGDSKIYSACPLLLDMWAVPIFLLASDDAIMNIFVQLAFLLLLNYFLVVESQE